MSAEPDDLYRGEAEIIPPGQSGSAGTEDRAFRIDRDKGVWRLRIVQPGPLGSLGLLLVFGLIVAGVLFLLVSALLVIVPLVGLVIAATVAATIARRYWRGGR